MLVNYKYFHAFKKDFTFIETSARNSEKNLLFICLFIWREDNDHHYDKCIHYIKTDLIENKPVAHTAVEDIVLDVLGVSVAENIIIILFFIILIPKRECCVY